MEVYKAETREVLSRFLRRRLSFPACIAALDAALAGVLPRLRPSELQALREVMLANNDIVMKEMERREQSRKAQTRSVDRQPRTTRCLDCTAETEADENGVTICVSCAQRRAAVTPETVRSVLQQELTWATERAAIASAEFLAITREVPSGLPQPDGVQRIRIVSHEMAFARAQLTKAHGRLEAFLMSGITPDDLKWTSDE
jgi:hypothetical protein